MFIINIQMMKMDIKDFIEGFLKFIMMQLIWDLIIDL